MQERKPAVATWRLRAGVGGRSEPAALLTHPYPLAKIDSAFATTRQRPDGFMKATIA